MIDVDQLTPDQLRNLLAVREVKATLEAKGIERSRIVEKPVVDDGTVNGRHWVHVRFGRPEPTCDHCQAREETSE